MQSDIGHIHVGFEIEGGNRVEPTKTQAPAEVLKAFETTKAGGITRVGDYRGQKLAAPLDHILFLDDHGQLRIYIQKMLLHGDGFIYLWYEVVQYNVIAIRPYEAPIDVFWRDVNPKLANPFIDRDFFSLLENSINYSNANWHDRTKPAWPIGSFEDLRRDFSALVHSLCLQNGTSLNRGIMLAYFYSKTDRSEARFGEVGEFVLQGDFSTALYVRQPPLYEESPLQAKFRQLLTNCDRIFARNLPSGCGYRRRKGADSTVSELAGDHLQYWRESSIETIPIRHIIDVQCVSDITGHDAMENLTTYRTVMGDEDL